MSYEPTNWVTGDIVTADKLNNIESGVLSASGSGTFIISMTSENDVDTLDKTWKEIHDAMASGQIAIILIEEDANTVYQNPIVSVAKSDGSKPYVVEWENGGGTVLYYATTENDYPSSDDGSDLGPDT